MRIITRVVLLLTGVGVVLCHKYLNGLSWSRMCKCLNSRRGSAGLSYRLVKLNVTDDGRLRPYPRSTTEEADCGEIKWQTPSLVHLNFMQQTSLRKYHFIYPWWPSGVIGTKDSVLAFSVLKKKKKNMFKCSPRKSHEKKDIR